MEKLLVEHQKGGRNRLKIWAKPQLKNEKSPLPVDVRRSLRIKMPLHKLPSIEVAAQ